MKRTITFLSLALGLGLHGVQGCGIDWSLPKNHFDGVNEFGFVSIWENLGSIALADGVVLPLNANFRSDRASSSSTLGSGWSLTLLDANIVQIDEQTFMMFDPTGPFRLFWRDAKNPNVLSGQAGWKAEIGKGANGDTITAWADCGGVKLVFNKGRITSMQLKDKVFTYNYQNGQVSEIREGNTPILKVEKTPISGDVTGLTLANNQNIQIERSDRPRIQIVNNQPLISGMEPSLSKVIKSDGTTITIDYAIDQNLNPTMKIGSRLITWNSATKIIISDNAWIYDIKPSLVKGFNASIARKNKSNQEELWFYDASAGKETVKTVDGHRIVNAWFTSGILSGKKRYTEERKDDITSSSKYIYTEAGRLERIVRTRDNEPVIMDTFCYDSQNGNITQIFRNGFQIYKASEHTN